MRNQIASALSDFFFEYETPRQVLVKNRRVGVVCRLIQLGVLVYIIGWFCSIVLCWFLRSHSILYPRLCAMPAESAC
ncbi:P2X purinoceptor 1, partial [Ilyodon furcidens]